MTEAEFPAGVIAEAVAAARAQLRLEGGQEDALLGRMAVTALRLAEAFTGQRLITRAFGDTVAADGCWRRLFAEPVTAITPGAYAVDIDAEGVGWIKAGGGGTVAVAYTAGLAETWAGLPAPVAQGCALLAAHLFEHRERDGAPPMAIAALWRPWRRVRIAGVRR